MTNILKQIMSKIGYAPWRVENVNNFDNEHTMIVGVDVCHLDQKGKSVVGFVFSIDKEFKQHGN